jgi:hypothetical protein
MNSVSFAGRRVTQLVSLALVPLGAFCAAPGDSTAPAPLQVGGYVKYLFSSVNTPSIGRLYDHLLHARVNGKLFLTEDVRIAAEVRNRVYYGESVEKVPGFFSSLRADHDAANADVIWWRGNSSLGYSELDRLSVEARSGRTQLTVGRQRIAWGTALVWNPTDLFNPLSVLDIDYEERPGVDAIRLQYFSSEVTKLEVVVKPGKTFARRVIAGKLLLNRWEYDLHLLGGIQGNAPFVGGAWAGDIAGAGFRGEILTKQVSGDAPWVPLRNLWSTSVAISGDYTFPTNTYLHTEVLFNDRGVTDSAGAFLPAARLLGLLSPARWSLYQEVAFDVHPLVRMSGFLIMNPEDRSSVLVPSIAWSALENFDISFFGLLFAGRAGTEYGEYGQSLFFRGKYSF